MNTRRNEAYKLRIQGKSYNEISSELGIAKSTLSSWFKDLVLSDAARARLQKRLRQGVENGLVRHNKLQTVRAEDRARGNREAGKREINQLSGRELMLVGTALYWAEGYKRLKVRNGKERMAHGIRLVNSDPEMIKVFIHFLRESMGFSLDAVVVTMRLYPHINEKKAYAYWMSVTGLPRSNFRRTVHVISGASRGIRPFNRLPWGTVEIQVCNTDKFHHLLGWIDGMKNDL